MVSRPGIFFWGLLGLLVGLWQQAVHSPGVYDLEVDTSVLSPEACADLIRQHLEDGPPPSAFQHLAAMATGEERAPK